jgi:geranylgeranyl pyrophosphate synthase
MRRGKPSTHILFGVDTALNAGNMLYFAAFRPILDMKIADDLKVRLITEVVSELTAIHIG